MSSHQEILSVLPKYFEGMYAGDVALLRSIFHPDAVLFGMVNGTQALICVYPTLWWGRRFTTNSALGQIKSESKLKLDPIVTFFSVGYKF
ncbi:Putative lumazine-binding protein [Caballeronia fortuita]|uniref:Lumazine-binding protein n=1 Tax=Caballeronia fortuita TaxID=1777138 RepID=A0A158CSZ1_9BURK|nr:nuclear transport factor 2 family protein [Caballeronia fortuita]SAK85341.1 Putative lumazine-binding protein [Caballeronia fortuita]